MARRPQETTSVIREATSHAIFAQVGGVSTDSQKTVIWIPASGGRRTEK